MRKSVVIFISILLIILFFCVCYTIVVAQNKSKMVETSTTLSDYNSTQENSVTENKENKETSEKENNTENNVENKKANNNANEVVNKDEKEAKTEKEEIYKAVDEKVYSITTVHIREKDNTESKVIATVNLGDILQRIAVGSNGWSKVKYNNVEGYISTQYISKEKPPEKEKVNKVSIGRR